MPQKAFVKFGVEHKMALHLNFNLYEIDPRSNKLDILNHFNIEGRQQCVANQSHNQTAVIATGINRHCCFICPHLQSYSCNNLFYFNVLKKLFILNQCKKPGPASSEGERPSTNLAIRVRFSVATAADEYFFCVRGRQIYATLIYLENHFSTAQKN